MIRYFNYNIMTTKNIFVSNYNIEKYILMSVDINNINFKFNLKKK